MKQTNQQTNKPTNQTNQKKHGQFDSLSQPFETAVETFCAPNV